MMSLNSKLISNKRKLDCDDDLMKETKKFVSILCNLPFFTFIKDSAKYMQNDKFELIDCRQSIGFFYMLPEEILLKILKLLSIEELGIFALTNCRIRNIIIDNFLISSTGYLHLIRANNFEFNNPIVSGSFEQQYPVLKLFSSIGIIND